LVPWTPADVLVGIAKAGEAGGGVQQLMSRHGLLLSRAEWFAVL
jgi:hypothetical protein